MSAVVTNSQVKPGETTAASTPVHGEERIIQLNSTTKITESALAALLARNKDWPFSADEDGWVMAHNTIRKDMKDFEQALATVVQGMKQGAALEDWQASHIAKYFAVMYGFIHHHHEIEEEIVFPCMKKKCELGERLSSDHKTLIELLDRCKDIVSGLKASQKTGSELKAVESLQAAFAVMQPRMCEHFKEEEEMGLPLLRMHFTAKEFVPIENRIKKGLKPSDLAHVLNPISSKEGKKEAMTHLGVPSLIQSLIMLPACKTYEKQVQRLVKELQQGKQAAPSNAMGCFGK